MKRLTVLYDARCSLCCRARVWLAGQRQIVPLELLPAASEAARRRFPELDAEGTLEELTAIGDGGQVYRGAKAWLLCLWALEGYRSLALRLSSPAALPAARRAFEWVSRHRGSTGGLLRRLGV